MSAGRTQSVRSYQPATLKIFSLMPRPSASNGPITNVGRQIPSIESDIGSQSAGEFFRTAATRPIGMPITRAMTIAIRPELQRDRKRGADDLGYRPSFVLRGQPEITVQQVAQIPEVLLAERPVQPVRRHHLLANVRRNRPLVLEWPARRRLDQEERHRHDHKQRRQRLPKSTEQESRHWSLVIGHWSLVMWLLAIGYWLLTVSSPTLRH